MRKFRYAISLLLALPLVAGCASVKPYQKEHLADPIMTEELKDEMRELKWLVEDSYPSLLFF